MREDGFSETSSISAGTYTSTIPGLGATSGKLRTLVISYGVDAILIRRRLAQIEGIFGQRNLLKSFTGEARKSVYNDLLELSRPVYSLSLCTRAFQVIMAEVGRMEIEDLAAAVVDWDASLSYDLLKAMKSCLQLEISQTSATSMAARYYDAGLNVYKSNLPYGSEGSGLCVAFLMFLGLVISLSQSPAFSRLVAFEFDLLTFISPGHIYPKILTSKIRWSKELFQVELVLSALLKRLDPGNTSLSIARLHELLSFTAIEDVVSQPSESLILKNFSLISDNDILDSIRFSISYLRNTPSLSAPIPSDTSSYSRSVYNMNDLVKVSRTISPSEVALHARQRDQQQQALYQQYLNRSRPSPPELQPPSSISSYSSSSTALGPPMQHAGPDSLILNQGATNSLLRAMY